METTNVTNQNGAPTNGQSQQLTVHEATVTQETNFFQSKDLFEHAQRVAMMLSKSDLVPKEYKDKVGNCVIALEMAYRMGVSPLIVMQNLNIILGKPAWSSTFLIASLNTCGKFSPLRYEENEEKGGSCRAWAIDLKSNEKVYGAWVNMEMAKAEGWMDKGGSKWKTMPELMRRYRAASFFTKQFAPEISMGFQTTEEVIDITAAPAPKANVTDKEQERISLLVADAKTIEQVDAIAQQCPDADAKLFTDRKAAIVADKQEEQCSIIDQIHNCVSISDINRVENSYAHLKGEDWFDSSLIKKKIAYSRTLTANTTTR